MSGKYKKALSFYITALLSLTTVKNVVSAGSFTDPARNSYALEKTLDRPYLQSAPVPRVWQTDSISMNFRWSLLNAALPETKEERYFETLFRQSDEQENRNDFQTLFFDERIKDFATLSEVVNYFIPVSGRAMETVLNGLAEADAAAADHKETIRRRDYENWNEELADIRADLRSLNETARWSVETEEVENFLRKKDRQGNVVLLEAGRIFPPDDILNKAEDITSFEVTSLADFRNANALLITMLVDDLLDLSTGIGIMENDDFLSSPEVVENNSKSASLLDRAEKNDQILEGSLPEKRLAILKRLQKRLEKENIKDAE